MISSLNVHPHPWTCVKAGLGHESPTKCRRWRIDLCDSCLFLIADPYLSCKFCLSQSSLGPRSKVWNGSHTNAVLPVVPFACSKSGAGSFWSCSATQSSRWPSQGEQKAAEKRVKIACLNPVLQQIQLSLLL